MNHCRRHQPSRPRARLAVVGALVAAIGCCRGASAVDAPPLPAAPTAPRPEEEPPDGDGDHGREACGFDPPKDYCGFCDGRYLRLPGEDCQTCSIERPGVRCSSDPGDYYDGAASPNFDGLCCSEFNCRLFGGCEFECAVPAIGCNGLCCERRDEVAQDFWEKAQEKAARWFLKRGARFVMGGCGLLCAGFIEFLFRPRRPNLLLGVDCWKLDDQILTERRTPVDPEYPALDNALITSASDRGAADRRRGEWMDYLEATGRTGLTYPYASDTPNLESAFAIKAKIPGLRSEFLDPSSPGSVHWLDGYLKTLYDEFSGCTECCKCSMYIDARGGEQPCMARCSKDVDIHFNFHVKGHEWPDFTFNETDLYEADQRYTNQYIPKGHYYTDPLLFGEVNFAVADAADEIGFLPRDQNKTTYEGILVGCHVYPFPWTEHANGVARVRGPGLVAASLPFVLFAFGILSFW